MATLSVSAIQAAALRFAALYYRDAGQTADLGADELRTLMTELDAWLDANAAAANNAIDATLRAKANTATKYAALAIVALQRAGLL